MDCFQRDSASPPEVRMSQTYAMTFVVVVILAFGAATFLYFGGGAILQILASI